MTSKIAPDIKANDPAAVVEQLTVDISTARVRATADPANANVVWSLLATTMVQAALALHRLRDDVVDYDVGNLLCRYLQELGEDELAQPLAAGPSFRVSAELLTTFAKLRTAGRVTRTGGRRSSPSGKAAYVHIANPTAEEIASLDAENS